MRFFPLLLLLMWAAGVLGQANRGEMRLVIRDQSGAALRARIQLDSNAIGLHESMESDEAGRATLLALPFGTYQLTIQRNGFAVYRATVEVQSALPLERRVALAVAGTESEVHVTDVEPLVDLNAVSSTIQIGAKEIGGRLSSLPGRAVQDIMVSQPGWVYEGNAVLHPRGSEYQTQIVEDGIPLTDNRSPSFGPAVEPEDLESMSIYTAGFPAEYGRKMGGVIELNTRRQTDMGLHGNFVVAGGSYDTLSGYGQLRETRKADAFMASASGAHTSHYLNPVVPQNFTNAGTLTDFAGTYARDLNSADRLMLSVRHETSRFEIPNELVQQQAGQVQNGANQETVGTIRFQGIVSKDSLILLSGMFRHNSKDLESNRNPTPIAAFQHNYFNDGYFKGTYALHHGRHELKAGVESDTTFLHENFHYTITDATQFDPDTPPSLQFAASRPDLEQAAFIEDLVRMKDWTASLGLRWDHYQLLLNRNAFSPRIAVGRSFRAQNLVLHASYDRVFQSPSSENILISSSAQVKALSDEFLRLPVRPSTGNDVEVGATKGFQKRTRLDVSTYWRHARNAADDDQLLNTGVSYPIAFDKSATFGAEGKLQVIAAKSVSGFLSYSYMVAKAWFPVTGGLFLGDDAANALAQTGGHFASTQDQRNTMATRWEWSAVSRVRVAGGATYGSGLPFEYSGTEAEALARYGRDVVSRLNFARGRVLPLLAINASMSVDVCRRDNLKMTLHIDGENLNNRLNVLDFGGLFSGNAIAPQRAVLLRWDSRF